MIKAIFVVLMIVIVCMGIFCAKHLTFKNPWWVRLIVLSPLVAASFSLAGMFFGNYVTHWIDIALELSLIAMYFVVCMALAGSPLLVLRTGKDGT